MGSAAMAGAAMRPPTARAVEPSKSFFIILPLIDQRLVRTLRPSSDRRPRCLQPRARATPPMRLSYKTRAPKVGQEMVARAPESLHTCGAFVTISAPSSAGRAHLVFPYSGPLRYL